MTAIAVLMFLLVLGWIANRFDYDPRSPHTKEFPPPDFSRRDLEG